MPNRAVSTYVKMHLTVKMHRQYRPGHAYASMDLHRLSSFFVAQTLSVISRKMPYVPGGILWSVW